MGAKNIILTGVGYNNDEIGATYYDGTNLIEEFGKKEEKSYHGTGDIFSSVIVVGLVNKENTNKVLKDAIDFVIESIKATKDDSNHSYGVKFEDVLNK